MPYTWNGQQFDEQTQQGATGAGLAGALAGMSSVSGFKWNGIADWLSRGVAGLYSGRDEYMSKAFDDKMQAETQARLKEESEMRQEYQNEQMDRIRREQARLDEQDAAADQWYQQYSMDPNPINSTVLESMGPPEMYGRKSDFANALMKRHAEVSKEIEKQQYHESAVKILTAAGIPPTGDPAKDIESADQLRDYRMKSQYDPQYHATREQTDATREATEAQREWTRAEAARDNYRAEQGRYEAREVQRVGLLRDLEEDIAKRPRYAPGADPMVSDPLPPMTAAEARMAAREELDRLLPSLPFPRDPFAYVSPSKGGGPSPFMQRGSTGAQSEPWKSGEAMPGGRMEMTLAQAMNESSKGSEVAPVYSGAPPVAKTEVNPTVGKMKQGFVLTVLESAVKQGELPEKVLQDWTAGDMEFRNNLLADVAAMAQERGISANAALILVMKGLSKTFTDSLRSQSGEIPHGSGMF